MYNTQRLQHRMKIGDELVDFIPNGIFMKTYDSVINNDRTYSLMHNTLTYKDLSLLLLYLLHKSNDSKIICSQGGMNLLDFSIDNLSNFNTIFNTPSSFLTEFSFDLEKLMYKENNDQIIVIVNEWILENGIGKKYESIDDLLVELLSVYTNIHIFDRRPPSSRNIQLFKHTNTIITDWGNNDYT